MWGYINRVLFRIEEGIGFLLRDEVLVFGLYFKKDVTK